MKKISKKICSVVMTILLGCVALTGCDENKQEATGQTETTQQTEAAEQTEAVEQTESMVDDVELEDVVVRIGGMSGPTSMGMVKLMEDAENSETEVKYEFAELSTDPAAFVAPLSKGEIDIAAVPSNLASVLYNKTEKGISVLAINTLGVLNIVERGDTVKQISDLAGKTVYATGEGATPEYTLRYVLNQAGLDADKDVTIRWCADTTEALSYVSADESAIAMLPQPFVTAALAQVEGLRVAIDMNEAWSDTEAGKNGSSIVTGVVVVRNEFLESYPNTVAKFLEEYNASINYVNENTEEAANLIEKYGIVAKAAIAMKALPECHITYIDGQEMKESLSAYLDILFEANPQAVGGNVPGDDFYYGL